MNIAKKNDILFYNGYLDNRFIDFGCLVQLPVRIYMIFIDLQREYKSTGAYTCKNEVQGFYWMEKDMHDMI